MKKKAFVFIGFVLVLVAFVYLGDRSGDERLLKVEAHPSAHKKMLPAPQASVTNKMSKVKLKELKNPKFEARSPSEESAEALSILFKKFVASESDSESLMSDLKGLDLEAKRTIQDLGEGRGFSVVRTMNSLKGTRYFHAQFFSDENGKEHLQHMSFEMSAKEPFERVRELAKAYLSSEIESETKRSDYHLWKMKNGYNVWVKVMTKEELLDDPFNAYTENDAGVRRLVIEQEIHPEGDGH